MGMIWNKSKECMSRDEMSDLQGKRLHKLVELVYHNVPFYREKMQALDLTPEDIKNIEDITGKLKSSSASLDAMMKGSVPSLIDNIDSISGDVKEITYSVRQMPLDKWTAEIDTAISSLKELSRSLESKDSSIGLLLNDKALYENLNSTVTSATNLLIDLKENPKRYVHFSLWGAKDKKDKKK